MSDRAPSGAIVIAAHNEAAVIGRCLDSLLPASLERSFQVIVVCNGCSDDTAAIATRYDGVTVLDLETASKAGALRAGDNAAIPGPRIYLDADIEMTERAAVAVFRTLQTGTVLASRPPLRFDYSGASRPVRDWYRVREQLPSIANVLWGAGTYALSVDGRARFDTFPEIVSDDLFIDSLFSADEVAIVPTDPVVVRTPRSTSALLKILVRTYRTQTEVSRQANHGAISTGQRGQIRDLATLLRAHPSLGPAAVTYVAVITFARARARFARPGARWERDDSSRR
jgi:glycosyltransferase involved in cell wall biosynthesis